MLTENYTQYESYLQFKKKHLKVPAACRRKYKIHLKEIPNCFHNLFKVSAANGIPGLPTLNLEVRVKKYNSKMRDYF